MADSWITNLINRVKSSFQTPQAASTTNNPNPNPPVWQLVSPVKASDYASDPTLQVSALDRGDNRDMTADESKSILSAVTGGVNNTGVVGGTGGGGSVLGESVVTTGIPGMDQMIQAAKDRYNALMGGAQSAYSTAQDYVNQGMGQLKEKRNQFQDLFKQGQGTNAQIYSQNAGQAGRTGDIQRRTEANSARALGLGGSYVQSRQGAINDALARTLASAAATRGQNESNNQQTLNDRMDWATGQESGLNNYLRSAADALRTAQGTNAADYAQNLGGLESTIGGYIQDIINNQNAIAAMKGSMGSYGTTQSPMLTTLNNYLAGVNNMLPNTSGSTSEQGVNLNDPTEILKRLYGGSAT